jgi:hypothetical protein
MSKKQHFHFSGIAFACLQWPCFLFDYVAARALQPHLIENRNFSCFYSIFTPTVERRPVELFFCCRACLEAITESIVTGFRACILKTRFLPNESETDSCLLKTVSFSCFEFRFLVALFVCRKAAAIFLLLGEKTQIGGKESIFNLF